MGKTAIITGGSRGIGAGITWAFAHQACSHIAITYNTNNDKAEEVLASVREINPKVKTCAIAGDVLDPDYGSKVVKQSLAGWARDRLYRHHGIQRSMYRR